MSQKSDSGDGRSAAGAGGTLRPASLLGREAECRTLDRLLADVRGGESRVLVLRGEAGVGKSALLDHLVARSSGCRVVAATGVQAEMELAFAAVHQLCLPMLDLLDSLPEPQHDALGTAFGMRAGPAPDQFLISLAVLNLLAQAADERPLVCVIDDIQWLDRASAQVLTFVARRLMAESVACVFAVRDSGETDVLPGLPVMEVGGLRDADARTLVSRVVPGPLDEEVRDRILYESRGNPLALLELPKAASAGGFVAAATGQSLSSRIEAGFQRRLNGLPADGRMMLLLAAAEPLGDTALLWRAADMIGIDAAAVDEADELIDFSDRVRFRHPLVRSAVYNAAVPRERRQAHRALAEATDAATDPDRRAWHRAHSAAHPDEGIAAELERSAGRAQARGGLAAAAAFLERAVELTPDARRRAERALDAARAKHLAGKPESTLALLATAETGPLGELQQARIDLLRAQLAFVTNRGSDAPPLLVKAAKRLEPIDAGLSRATYLDAMSAAMFAGRLARPGGGMLEVASAAGAAPRPLHAPRAPDLLLDGFAALFNEGCAAAVPILRRALAAFGGGMSADEELRWMWLACVAALHIWDDDRWEALSGRYVELVRSVGALSELPLALTMRAHLLLFTGDLTAAGSLIDEVRAATEATGSNLAPYGAITLAALRGREAEASALIEVTTKDVTRRGEGVGITTAELATTVLNNGLGRYSEAMIAAQRAVVHERDLGVSNWAAVELIEAATRSGTSESAAGALRRLAEITGASGTDWALGVEARSRALLTEGEAAECLYQESITHLGRTRFRSDLARAHLLYGEWLRRERHRTQARQNLRTAFDLFTEIGMKAFADRAARELQATGETARKRNIETTEQLTPQEAQIARLARTGLTNKEIATRLYVSPRTVEHHLRKVFTKLGVASRHQLEELP
ncbi:ATP-binding protein [Actinomadura sp. 6N118]|uniref:ATP-binding protein n=1 Tax=Actinomadura sp. 6N118 TaxID=3375151 RepID=UPI003798AABB